MVAKPVKDPSAETTLGDIRHKKTRFTSLAVTISSVGKGTEGSQYRVGPGVYMQVRATV